MVSAGEPGNLFEGFWDQGPAADGAGSCFQPCLSLTCALTLSQMADLQQEHQREIEGLLENIRQLSRELRLQMLIIDNFIPQDYQVGGRFSDLDIRSVPWPRLRSKEV